MTEIVKADGSAERFDGLKLEASLRHAGASGRTATDIRTAIEKTITQGARTASIYKRAFALLRERERAAAARYSLRRAMFELGPTGHPFEDFIAQLFKKEGWTVEWRRLVPGKCVPHEVDVYATRSVSNGSAEGGTSTEHLAAELKYHNDPNYKTDVKTALYVKARFDDIWQCDPKLGKQCPVDRGMLITNTKFTSQAIQYASCAGIELLGWSYPLEGNLYDRIIGAGVYPVTALTTLKKAEKVLLIANGVITTDLIRERRDVLRSLSMTPERIGLVIAEAESLIENTSISRSEQV